MKYLIAPTVFLFSLPLASANAFQDFGRDIASMLNSILGLQEDFMIRLALFAILYGVFHILVNKVPAFKPESGESDYVGARHIIAFALALLIMWSMPDEYITMLREIIGLSFVYLFLIVMFTALLYLSYKGADPSPATYFFRSMVYVFGFILFLHLTTADLGFIDLAETDFNSLIVLFALVMLIMLVINIIHFITAINKDAPQGGGGSRTGEFIKNLFRPSTPDELRTKKENRDKKNKDKIDDKIKSLKRWLAWQIRRFSKEKKAADEKIKDIKNIIDNL